MSTDALESTHGPADLAVQTGLARLVDNLLTTVSEVAPETEPHEAATFQARITQHRRQIAGARTGADLATEAAACTKTCEQYLRRSLGYYTERESEFTEMIAILREAAELMAGDSFAFNAQVLASSEQLSALTQLEDIRVIRKQIAAQVEALKQTVQKKQKHDEESYGSLNRRVEALQSRLLRVEEEASLDPVTRIANRGAFDRALRRMIVAARRAGVPLSLAMIDVDNFKAINDAHGHQVGDRVLLCAAMALENAIRKTDFVARYGGEEFALVLHDVRASQAEARLASLVNRIAGQNYEYEADDSQGTVQFTVSCGVTELAAGDDDADIVRRADEALYDAKRQGKNRVVMKKRSLLGGLLG